MGPSGLACDRLIFPPLRHGWVVGPDVNPSQLFFIAFPFSSPLLFPSKAENQLRGSMWKGKEQKQPSGRGGFLFQTPKAQSFQTGNHTEEGDLWAQSLEKSSKGSEF